LPLRYPLEMPAAIAARFTAYTRTTSAAGEMRQEPVPDGTRGVRRSSPCELGGSCCERPSMTGVYRKRPLLYASRHGGVNDAGRARLLGDTVAPVSLRVAAEVW
jgi:hypothetical protein